MMFREENQKDLRAAFKWYFTIHIVGFKNKIKSLSIFQLIGFIASILFGIFFIYKNILQKTLELKPGDGSIEAEIFWLIIVYVLVRLLANKKSASVDDIILLSIARREFNAYFIYDFLKSIKLYIPVVFAIYYALLKSSVSDFFYAFIVILLFNLTVSALVAYLELIRTIKTDISKIVVKLVLMIGSALCISLYLLKVPVPDFLQYLAYPLLVVISSIIYRINITHPMDAGFYITQLLLFTGILSLFLYRLSKIRIRLSHELSITARNVRVKKEKTNVRKSDTLSPLLEKEFTLIKHILLKGKGILGLVMPNIIYILISIYGIHTDYVQQNYSNVHVNSIFPLFSIIGFPIIFLLPQLRKENKYLWLYRLTSKGLFRYINIKLVVSFLYCQISLLISNIIIVAVLYYIFGIKYFDFIVVTNFLLVCIIGPVIPCLFVFFLSSYLSDVYFMPNSDLLQMIPMITIIWITSVLCAPTVIFSYLILEKSFLFALVLIALNVVAIYIGYNLLYRYLKHKEI